MILVGWILVSPQNQFCDLILGLIHKDSFSRRRMWGMKVYILMRTNGSFLSFAVCYVS